MHGAVLMEEAMRESGFSGAAPDTYGLRMIITSNGRKRSTYLRCFRNVGNFDREQIRHEREGECCVGYRIRPGVSVEVS